MTAIRAATPADVPEILRMVRELAIYEREPDAVEATEDDFARALFPVDGRPTTFCQIAEVAGPDRPEVAGIAIWYLTFSTWTGVNGIWLEDLFVAPQYRGSGLGKALLASLAAICVERGYRRLQWWVLDWNTPSIEFYQALGARAQDEWTVYRVDGPALTALAG